MMNHSSSGSTGKANRLWATCFAGLLLVSATAAGADNTIIVRPSDTGAILVNPGMGWVFHHYDDSLQNYGGRLEPWDTVDDFPGVGVIYLRLAWSYLEPEEGKFNWSFVDIPAQRWIAKGKRIALRFTCDEDTDQQPAVPEWVRKAGASGYYSRQDARGISHFSAVGDSKRWAVDFDDPVFLDKLDHFLAAAAERYDGDPNVAFIDVGSLGIWGEGDPREFPYSAATVQRHIDLHRKHFKHTLLALNDNSTYQGRGGEKTLIYAADQGLTMRDDSILVWGAEDSYFSQMYAGLFWPQFPVILESEHYGPSRKRGNWGEGAAYLQAVEDYHASYVSVHWWPREFLNENRQLVERISLRMGYRLQLLEAGFPAEVPANGKFKISHKWRNAGVAPCLPGGYVCFTLKGERGGIVGVFVDDDFNVRSLPVGPPGKADGVERESTFTLPLASILKPGAYEAFVSVGSRIGTPQLALPLAQEDGQMRYRIGTLRVLEGPAQAGTGPSR